MSKAQSFEDFLAQIELIKNSEARLYEFLDQMPIGVFIIDKNYRVIFSNRRSNEILGWDFLVTTHLDKIHETISFYHLDLNNTPFAYEELPLVRSIEEGKIVEEEMLIKNTTGQSLVIRVITTPIFQTPNSIGYALAIFETININCHQILSDILNFSFQNKSFKEFVDFITEKITFYLNIPRAGFWLFSSTYIECLSLYNKDKKNHERGFQIFKKDFPVYFNYINKGLVLAVEDANAHEATREFSNIYFEPNQIYSTLDCPIFVNNQLYAIICCENTMFKRKWFQNEIEWIQNVSKLTSLMIEKHYLSS